MASEVEVDGPNPKRVRIAGDIPLKSETGRGSSLGVLPLRLSSLVQNPALARQLQEAEDAVIADKWCTEAWTTILDFAETVSPIDDQVRAVYDAFLTLFPTASRQWKIYLEAEAAARRFDKVEEIVKKSLLSCLDVDLWLAYVTYIEVSVENEG